MKIRKNITLQADEFLVKKFVKKNSEIWNREHGVTEKYCYIDNWISRDLASLLPQLVFAQGLANTNSLEICVLSQRVAKEWKMVNRSFGAQQAIIQRRGVDKIYGLFKALKLVIQREKGEKVLEISYKGMPIGEVLYDTIIRTTEDQWTIEHIRLKNWRKIYDFFANISCLYHIFEKKQPNFYMPFERCHMEGAFAMVASHFGAQIIQCTSNGRILDLGRGVEAKIRWHDIQKKVIKEFLEKEMFTNYENTVKKYLEKRFEGLGNIDVKNAFAGKKIISRERFMTENDLDPSKKNIVMMLHVFSDEPHSSEFLLFRDYYVWYRETMKMINNIKNVNWIIKAHPSRKMYGEDREAYNVFVKYQQKNIVWFPEEYSTASLADIADAIITVQGTAGTEFSCLGKPIILCGKAFYSELGFTIEPQTVDEYYHILQNLENIQPLSKTSRENACKAEYAYLNMEYRPFDDFDEILVRSYAEETKAGNNKVLEILSARLEKEQDYYFNSKFYKIGENFGEDVNKNKCRYAD